MNPALVHVPPLSNRLQQVWTDGQMMYVCMPGHYMENSAGKQFLLRIADPGLPRCLGKSWGT